MVEKLEVQHLHLVFHFSNSQNIKVLEIEISTYN